MTSSFEASLTFAALGSFGLVFGSFVTALSYRLPRGESIARGRSRCPACGHVLTVPDLVPVLSWAAQGGACRHCRAPISWRYPAIEGVTAALFIVAGVYLKELTPLLLVLAMTPVMVALSVIDFEHRRLPNGLILFLAALAVGWRMQNPLSFPEGLLAAVTTAGAAIIVGVALDKGFHMVTQQPGLGMGDTKLFAVAGVALGLGPFLLFMTLAGVLGVALGVAWRWRANSGYFPFAPAILTAYWLSLVLGEQVLQKVVMFSSG